MKIKLINSKLVFSNYAHFDFTDNTDVNKALCEIYVNDNTDMSQCKYVMIINCTYSSGSGKYQFGINFYDGNNTNLGWDGVLTTSSQNVVRSKKKAVFEFAHGYFIIDPDLLVPDGQSTGRLPVTTWSGYSDLNNSPNIEEYLSNQ